MKQENLDLPGKQKKRPIQDHERINWKYIKRMIQLGCKSLNINIGDYDINTMRTYVAQYDEFLGSNVKTNLENNASPIIANLDGTDGEYRIFEIPKLTNKKFAYGDFIFIAANRTAKFWVFSKMSIKMEGTNEVVRMNVIGIVLYDDKNPSKFDTSGLRVFRTEKTRNGKINAYCTFQKKNQIFDSKSTRKKAYNLLNVKKKINAYKKKN